MLGLEWHQLLGLAGVAAIVAAIGNLIALLLKDFLAVRSFEQWKAKRTLLDAYRRYQLPLFLAADELSARLYGLSRDGASPEERDIGRELLLGDAPQELTAAAGGHYWRYRYASHVYRLCSFLGWMELYRGDIGALDPGILDRNGRLEACLSDIKGTLADGWLNQHEDRGQWRDALLFREEQRAIGRRMALGKDRPEVIDFGTFYEILVADPEGKGAARWFLLAAAFFERLEDDRDFRLVRMKMLVVHLTTLMELLQPGRIPRVYVASADEFRRDLARLAGQPSSSATPSRESEPANAK